MTPEQQLADAKAKYHLLVTGQAARVVQDQNGEKVEYTAVKSSDLLAYIRMLDPSFLVDPARPRVSGPLRFYGFAG